MATSDDSIARQRLAEERKDLQAEPRPAGLFAKPSKRPDGSTDMLQWSCGIVAPKGSAYRLPDGAAYALTLVFPPSYPVDPPIAYFQPPVFHTNVFPDTGSVCLSLLLEAGHHRGTVASHWTPSVTVKQVLLGLQAFLDEPNAGSVANAEACELLRKSGKAAYEQRVRREAAGYEARRVALVAQQQK